MRLAAEAARRGVTAGLGGPFGAAIVADGEVIAVEHNRVVERNDPTAHAEILAIRAAAQKLGRFHLEGCTLISTCEPCPMCLAAAHWAHVDAIVFASTRDDAAAGGFDDAAIYAAIEKPRMPVRRLASPDADALWALWAAQPDRTDY